MICAVYGEGAVEDGTRQRWLIKTIQILAVWLSWLESHPVHQKAAGLIPSQGTYLGCRFDPRWGCVQEATD